MKSVVLIINGGVFGSMVPDESAENMRVLLDGAIKSKKRGWWQKPAAFIWLATGSKKYELVIKSGSLDAYSITDAPPPQPDRQSEALELQREAIDQMKRAMDDGKEADEWKKE